MSAPERKPRVRRSLATRLALWIGLSTAASIVVYALVAYTVVLVAESHEPDEAPAQIAAEATLEVGAAVLLAAPFAIALSVLAAVVLTRRALRPLDDVMNAAHRMTPRDVDQRLPLPETDDEVRAVVATFNALLQRLEVGFHSLGRFAGEASHELRTPLAVVATELEVMLQSPRSSQEWQASARTCLDEIRHMTRLVEAMLELARTDGHVARPRDPVDLRDVVARVTDALGPRARERRVRLETVGGDDAAVIAGDADALASAIGNVVENAVVYTPAGGAVGVAVRHDDGGRIALVVDDSGPGIDPAEVDHIFEPFARGAAARARSAEAERERGAGLGLHITRRILDLHGATIAVTRSPRGGARFTVAFAAPAR